jgi:hypothetical protein
LSGRGVEPAEVAARVIREVDHAVWRDLDAPRP